MTTTVIQTVPLSDAEAQFRSRLLTGEKDGVDLLGALDRMSTTHPNVARHVVKAGTLGVVSYGRALECLRTYASTKVAMPPQYL